MYSLNKLVFNRQIIFSVFTWKCVFSLEVLKGCKNIWVTKKTGWKQVLVNSNSETHTFPFSTSARLVPVSQGQLFNNSFEFGFHNMATTSWDLFLKVVELRFSLYELVGMVGKDENMSLTWTQKKYKPARCFWSSASDRGIASPGHFDQHFLRFHNEWW